MNKALILNTLQEHYGFKKDVDFADFLGISGQLLSKWKTRNTFDPEVLYTKCTGVSSDYLLSGQEPILKQPLNIIGESATNHVREEKKLIPLYDGVVTAGMNETAILDHTHEPAEMIDAGDWFRDATAAMRVHGDSMYPEYKSGSIAALREVRNKRLVVYGQDYLIETSEYRVIKRLQKSDVPQNWLACSVNEEKYEATGRLIHEPFDVHIDDVTRLYQVLGNVKRNQSSTVIHAKKTAVNR
jgi:hypothetical protein